MKRTQREREREEEEEEEEEEEKLIRLLRWIDRWWRREGERHGGRKINGYENFCLWEMGRDTE